MGLLLSNYRSCNIFLLSSQHRKHQTSANLLLLSSRRLHRSTSRILSTTGTAALNAISIGHHTHPLVELDKRIMMCASTYLNSTKTSFLNDHKCRTCFLFKPICICSTISAKAANSSLNIKFPNLEYKILMHYKEYGRPSNTGKLLPMLSPNHSSVHIYGTDESLHMVNYLMSNNGIVLFTDKLSSELNIDSFSRSLDTSDIKREKSNVICVIDATWREAKTINKWLPRSIPRYHLPDVGQNSSLFMNRKRALLGSVEHTFSTIESVSRSLEVLHAGLKPAADVSFNKAFNEVLKYSVDAVFRQRGSKSCFGNDIVPDFSGDNACDRGPFIKAQVEKPKVCPSCGETNGTRFKNRGVHPIGAPGSGTGGSMRRWKCRACGDEFACAHRV